jgi:hypothetical protein
MEITHPGLTEIKRWSGRMEELTGHPGMEEPARPLRLSRRAGLLRTGDPYVVV